MGADLPTVLAPGEAIVHIPAHRVGAITRDGAGITVALVVTKHLSALIHDALITPDPDVGPHPDDAPFYCGHAPEMQP